MTAEYQLQILDNYRRKQEEDSLSPNLQHMTAAKIKRESLLVFNQRYLTKDEKLLQFFFNEKREEADLRQAIKKFDPDRFKPLLNFLRGQTGHTDEKNIALLAWLIDFEPRPFRRGLEGIYEVSQLPEGNIPVTAPTSISVQPATPAASSIHQLVNSTSPIQAEEQLILQEHNSPTPSPASHSAEPGLHPGSKQAVSDRLKRYFLLLMPALLILLFSIWLVIRSGKAHTKSPQQCMYWDGSSYHLIPCNKPPGSAPIHALDRHRLHSLHRIRRPDTLTESSIGRVGYFKNRGAIEFFTDTGMHPVYTNRRLKPLTNYIIQKYIYPKNNR